MTNDAKGEYDSRMENNKDPHTITRIFYVRHAEPDHAWREDATRPLTALGLADSREVEAFFREIPVTRFVSSPYERSRATIRLAAESRGLAIETEVRLRERKVAPGGNTREWLARRWADLAVCEEGGESIDSVQRRNVEVLREILAKNAGESVVVGTHGTALASVIRFFRPEFGYEDFWRMIDFMPYIVEMCFVGGEFAGMRERLVIRRPFEY